MAHVCRGGVLLNAWMACNIHVLVAGTQVPDRTWLTLKSWLPRLVAKVKVLEHSKMNAEISEYIYQLAWRRSLPPVETTGALLCNLYRIVRRNGV